MPAASRRRGLSRSNKAVHNSFGGVGLPPVLVSQIIPEVESGSPGGGSRLGFFNLQSSRTLARIEESARTINPTTQRLRATVKNRKRNATLKI